MIHVDISFGGTMKIYYLQNDSVQFKIQDSIYMYMNCINACVVLLDIPFDMNDICRSRN